MSRHEIFTKVENIFKDLLDDDNFKLKEEMNADDLQEWDSLFHITLVASIEDEFKISISTADVGKAKNIGVLLDMIEEELKI